MYRGVGVSTAAGFRWSRDGEIFGKQGFLRTGAFVIPCSLQIHSLTRDARGPARLDLGGTLRLYERVEEDGPVHRCAGAATRSLDRAAKSQSEALSRTAERWVNFPPAAPGVPTTTVRRTCPARKSTPTFRNISCRVPSPGRAGGQQSPTRTASKSGRINLVKGIQDSSKPPTFHRIDGSVYIGDMCLSCAELFSI